MKQPLELTGPLAPHVSGFLTELRRQGYTASPRKKHSYLVARLSRWLEEQSLDLSAVATSAVEPFFAARRTAGIANLRTRASLRPLVKHLARIGSLHIAEPTEPASQTELVLARFSVYLASERGLVQGTVRFYMHVARLFLDHLASTGVTLSGFNAQDVTTFTTRVCQGRGLSSCRQVVSALRSFLRFLALEGVTVLALDGAVFAVAGWNPSLPKAISVAHVQRLVTSCDRRTAVGRRDHAILVLLARLGLRGGEVVAMELGDLNWRAGELVVRGKGRHRDRLPLPAEVGEAVAGYLRRGRPSSDSRRVFLRSVAPFVGFEGTGAVRGVMQRACARAGLAYVSPHRLRHTTATEMLRGGSGLVEIGQVLRHRSSATTAIYAKVDHDQLRLVARPWPEAVA